MNSKILFQTFIFTASLLPYTLSFAGSESHGGHVVVTFASIQDREKVEKVLEENAKGGRSKDPLDGINLGTLKVESLDLFLERKRGLPDRRSDVLDLEDLPKRETEMNFVDFAESRIELMKGKTDFYDFWMNAFKKTVGDARRWVGSDSGVTITKDSGLGSGEGSALHLSKNRLALNIAVQNELQITYDERLMERAGLIDASAVVNHETGWAYSVALGLTTSVPIQKFVGLMYEKSFAALSGVAIAAEVARLGLLKAGTVESVFSGGQMSPSGWVGGSERNVFRTGQAIIANEIVVVAGESFRAQRIFTNEIREPDSGITRHKNGKISSFVPHPLEGESLRIQGFPVRPGTMVRFHEQEELMTFITNEPIKIKNIELPANAVVEISVDKNLVALAAADNFMVLPLGNVNCFVSSRSTVQFYDNGQPKGCGLHGAVAFDGVTCVAWATFYKNGSLESCSRVTEMNFKLRNQSEKLHAREPITFYESTRGRRGPPRTFVVAQDQKSLKLYDRNHKALVIHPNTDPNRILELDADGWMISYQP
jgi:hypothetical protein